MKSISKILLCWRKGAKGRRYIVGEIKQNSSRGVIFKYYTEVANQAKEEGFTAYVDFPNLNETYTENVLEKFSQRLTKTDRNDYKKFLSFWEIDKELAENKFALLAFTQGLSLSDNFEFLADFYPVQGLHFVTDIAGINRTKPKKHWINIGDKILFKKEPENEYDNLAVRLFTSNGEHELGYIKKVHNKVFHNKKNIKLNVEVKHIESNVNGEIQRIFVRVFI